MEIVIYMILLQLEFIQQSTHLYHTLAAFKNVFTESFKQEVTC